MKKIEQVYQRINKIDYMVIDNQDKTSFQVYAFDEHELEIEENSFKIIHSRNVFFEPEGVFTLKIITDIEYFLNDSVEGFELSESYINENIEKLLETESTALEYVSQLIVNISSVMGKTPIVTPPVYLRKNEE